MLLNCVVGEDSWESLGSIQSILKEISSGCSLEGLMLKLKLQYFSHLMRRADSFEKTLMLGEIEERRRRGGQSMRWLEGISNSMDMGLGGLQEFVMDRGAGVLWFMGLQRVRHDWATELNWTENINKIQWCMHSALSNKKQFYFNYMCCNSILTTERLLLCLWYSSFLVVFCCFFKWFYLFIFGCAAFLLPCGLFSNCSEQGPLFIALWRLLTVVASFCRAQAWGHADFSSCGTWFQRLQFLGSQLLSTGPIVVALGLSFALPPMGSSQSRDLTCVSCIGRRILYH